MHREYKQFKLHYGRIVLKNTFNEKKIAILHNIKKLTCHIENLKKVDVIKLKQAGCDHGEILEVNQVAAYFNYSNRILNGLGVSLDGDKIGYYSS